MQLYLVRLTLEDTGEDFLKIGVSKNAATRFDFGTTPIRQSGLSLREQVERSMAGKKYISDMPYNVETLHVVDFKYEGDARLRENHILQAVRANQYRPQKPFSGSSECFTCEDQVRDGIIQWMTAEEQSARPTLSAELWYNLASAQIRKTGDPVKDHVATLAKMKAIRRS